MTSWYDFYKERQNERYKNHIRNKYRDFLFQIAETQSDRYIELGCGAGNITRVLREEFRRSRNQYMLVDSCPRMLSLALENNQDPDCFFRCADITKTVTHFGKPFNVTVHSHGVLEHFEDDQIRDILLKAKKISDYQVHYVPSHKYLIPSRGDERLLTVQEWLDIVSPLFSKAYVKEFNEGYDLAIVTGMEF